jgi:predicted Fe-Mo cluster-binding NifX family protein
MVSAVPSPRRPDLADHCDARVIAVALADGQGLESTIAPHYGRCPFYLVAVTEGPAIRATRLVPNPLAADDQPGDMLAFLRRLGADVVVTGAVGPGATNRLARFGIEEVTGRRGRVTDALAAYLEAG